MTSDATHRIEVYLRGDTYGTYGRQAELLSRVRGLESEGVIADASVEASWQRIRTPEQDGRDEAIDTYEEFRDWAHANGYRLEPAFERRYRSYVGTDAVSEVVVFPVVSLAVYEGDDLQAVFPCSDDDGEIHFGVADCLDALEERDPDWFEQFAPVDVDRREPYLAATA